MKRAKHTLSHYRMHTADMGELFPIACVPVLPGDTIQHSTSALVRMSPLNTPVMHPCQIRIHHFFYPNRLAWPQSENGGWEEFITGGPDGNNSATIPFVQTQNIKKSVLAYLGAPPTATPRTCTSLALRAFNAIFNEYFRDQDIVTERAIEDDTLPKIAWEKDYFTTARPWTQKGSEVTLPVGTKAPVTTDAGSAQDLGVIATADSNNLLSMIASAANVARGTNGSTVPADQALYADLSAAGAISVNDFREAFAVQRYQEARARYGSRFTEYLRYCGITPSDARLQRPEYLGGGTTRLNFSEVLQTAPNNPGVDQNGIGDLYGHGIAGVRSNAYRKFFEEHGYIISVMSIRPKSIYMNGAHREFLKGTKEDFFQKELAGLGQQEVKQRELFMNDPLSTVFGYQDRYDEYRQHPSWIAQDFRDTLNSWHLARDLSTGVTLNPSFINCAPSKRIFQVETDDTCWVMANHRMVARRMVPKRARPRIL